jgi:hypothetical protein
VTVLPTCFDSTDTISITPASIGLQQYVQGDALLSINVASAVSASICNTNDIVYSLTVSPPAPFITLQGTNLVCSTEAFVGAYTVSVTSSIIRSIDLVTQSSIFTLEVIAAVPVPPVDPVLPVDPVQPADPVTEVNNAPVLLGCQN